MRKQITSINKLLLCIAPIFMIICFFMYMNRYSPGLQDSDSAAELILSNLLSKQGSIMSKDWYYSTELRVFNIQLVFTPLFGIFSDWHKVRVAGCIILLILYGISALVLAVGIGLKKQWIFLLCCMILAPFSMDYLTFVMVWSYYIPHIAVSFITIGLFCVFLSKERGKSNFSRVMIIVITVLLAFLSGLGGKRQLLILYIPLLMASVLKIGVNRILSDWRVIIKNRGIWLSGVLPITATAGALINSRILNNMYSYWNWETMNYTGFSIERMMGVINGFLRSFGYTDGTVSSLPLLIHNGIAIAIMIVLVYIVVEALRLDKDEHKNDSERLIALILLIGMVILVMLFSFTDMLYNDRYNLPIVVFFIPLLLLFFRRRMKDSIFRIHMFYPVFTISIFLLNSLVIWKESIPDEMPTELMQAAATAADEGYMHGYGTFWNSNIMTELSNGAIEMITWNSDLDNMTSLNYTYRWLQLIEHDTEIPDGKVFCIFNRNEWNLPFVSGLTEGQLLYDGDEYRVYGYENYDALNRDAFDN